MEIVFFVYEFPLYIVGGLGTYAEYMTREFIKMGRDVTVFSMHTENAPTRDVYMGVEVHRLIVKNMNLSLLLPMFIPEEVRRWSESGKRYFGDIFLYNVLSASKLINDLVRTENRKVDLVVSHDWFGSVGGILSSRELNNPLVFHVHSTEQRRSGNGYETLKRLEKITADHAERIVTVRYAMRDHLVRLCYPERKIRVVHNGIDAEKYSPTRVSPDEFMILFVGRLNWVKGADTLVQSMPEILSSIPNVKLVIVGVGDQQELKYEVSKLDIEDKVILTMSFYLKRRRSNFMLPPMYACFPPSMNLSGLSAQRL